MNYFDLCKIYIKNRVLHDLLIHEKEETQKKYVRLLLVENKQFLCSY